MPASHAGSARSARQHGRRVERLNVLRPRLGRAHLLATAPTTPTDLEAHRPPEARQVTHRPRCAGLRLSPRAAQLAPRLLGRRLHRDHELVIALGHAQHPHAGQPQQQLHHRDTVDHARGSFHSES